MTKRSIFSSPLFWIGSLAIPLLSALANACSSPPPETGCTSGETLPCTCASGHPGTTTCGSPVCSCEVGEDAGTLGPVDSGNDAPAVDTPGDATHLDDKPAPTSAYGACAIKGSFGSPCTATTSGPDPTECTDPNFPDCFVGGQGAWCTISCATFGVCFPPGEDAGDAGCTPTACNARGYCK